MKDDLELEITPFEDGDLTGLLEMILAIQQGEFGRFDPVSSRADLHAIAATYQAGAGGYWVAKAQGRVVGGVGLKDIGGRRAVLKRMYVAAPWRGLHGAAKPLLDVALAHAQVHGAEEVVLGTIDILAAAQRFYAKHGFEPLPREAFPADAPLDPADTHFYRRRLLG